MAISKDSVKVKFTAKFGKVNLSKNFKESLINKIANRLENEDDIDSTLESYEDVVTEAASEADRIRTELKKVEKPTEPTKKEDVVELPADTPEWAKALLKKVSEQDALIQTMNSARQTETLVDRFKKDERLKGIPEFILKGYVPSKEEEIESNIEAVTTAFSKFAQDNKLANVGADAINKGGDSGVGEIQQKVLDGAIKEWGDKKIAQANVNSETIKK